MEYQHATKEDLMNQVIVEGDLVVVAEDKRQTYRPDLKVVVVKERRVTKKIVKYFLSDGSIVIGTAKMYKIDPKPLPVLEIEDEAK